MVNLSFIHTQNQTLRQIRTPAYMAPSRHWPVRPFSSCGHWWLAGHSWAIFWSIVFGQMGTTSARRICLPTPTLQGNLQEVTN